MAEIQKIFFYTGTALVDPDGEYGCPFHPDQKESVKDGLCTVTCNNPLQKVYRCSDHPDSKTTIFKNPCKEICNNRLIGFRYKCVMHEVIKEEKGQCTEKCGQLAQELDSNKWGCSYHSEETFKEKPVDWKCPVLCGKKLYPVKYICEKHKDSVVTQSGTCKVVCNQSMTLPTGELCCTKHPESVSKENGNDKCQQECGLKQVPTQSALGYRRNVSVFMKYVGKYIKNGEGWGFCVNVAHDHIFKSSNKDSENQEMTLSAGRRRFRYYAPKEAWGDDTKVDDYLKTFKSLDGKFELFVNTASLLKNRTTPLSLGWKDRYDLVQGFGPKQGTKKTVDNCSAKCFSSDLDALKEWLSEAVKDQSVFAVCDCNSFHNSAFLFGLLALSRHVKSTWQIDQVNLQKVSAKNSKINTVAELSPEPVLVLNFDRHNDEGEDIKFANSDGWGKPLLKSLKTGAYLAIGVPEGRRSGGIVLCIRRTLEDGQYELKRLSGKNLDELISEIQKLNPESSSQQDENSSGGGAPSLPSMDEKKPANKMDFQRFENKDKWKEIFEQIETFLNTHVPEHKKKKSLKYYYITIDRDCMLHNHNQWSDDLSKGERGASFFSDEKHIHKAIEAIRKALGEDAVLTGMDITGLPESQYLPGTGKTLVSIPRKEDLESARIRDKNCVYSECKKKREPKKGCSNPECNNKHLRHPECGHKICPYKSCPSANCPEPECKGCREVIMEKLGEEIKFWYEKFDGWISAQEKKKVKV